MAKSNAQILIKTLARLPLFTGLDPAQIKTLLSVPSMATIRSPTLRPARSAGPSDARPTAIHGMLP
ncbi:MAG: hypothetical protein VX290_08505 [Candidatus Latescibacterota bacterium]|nr:hypothetical protein [Candidatus Latescibacterota bacterium]